MKVIRVVFFMFLVTDLCCSEGEEIKQLERREAYNSGKYNQPERDNVSPNDFGIPRNPPPSGGSEHLPYDHGNYHGSQNGPSDFHHHNHYDHQDQGNRQYMGEAHAEKDESYFSNSLSNIPLDFAKSLNEYNVSDLLLNFIDDGPVMDGAPLLADRFGGDDTERNAAEIARPAKCMPELQTVKIVGSNESNVFYVPECTRIERCGGCCSHVLLSCQPVETETVTLTVIKTVYSGNKRLKYYGKEPVVVEKHTKCKCGCKIKEQDCNSYQEYRESECRCVCKNLDEESKCYKDSYKKLWNPDLCACQCREIEPCSTGYQFDHNECRCIQSQIKRRYILGLNRKEEPGSS